MVEQNFWKLHESFYRITEILCLEQHIKIQMSLQLYPCLRKLIFCKALSNFCFADFTPCRSFNETARDDSELSDEQAANMRFVVTGDLKEEHALFTSDPASVVAEQVKSIADRVEEELRKDDVSDAIKSIFITSHAPPNGS